MSIWSDLWAEAGNGDGVDISKLNILTVRPGATVVEGKVYPDIISAQDYAVTQVPSATNIFVIEGSKGFVNSEDYVVKDWIQLRNFILDGEITTNIAPGGAFERGLIIDCICSNVSGTAAKILIFVACKITGGTAVAGSFIVPIQDSIILGGDFSLAAAFITATSNISGGTFGGNVAVFIRLSQVGSNAGSPTLSGGTITKSVIEMDLVIANTETIEMFDCTFESQVKTITIESGGTLNCENLSGKNLTINVDAGGILNSWNISNRITVNNSGTWNNKETNIRVFTFTDSGPDEASNIYTSWPNLITAMAAISGPKTLYLSPVSTGSLSASVVTDVDFSDVTIIGIGATRPNLVFADGFTFADNSFPKIIKNCGLAFANTVTPVCNLTGTLTQIMRLDESVISNGGNKAGAFIKASSINARLDIYLRQSSISNSADESVFDINIATGIFTFFIYDGSKVDDETLGGITGSTYRLNFQSSENMNDETPASFSQFVGTLQIIFNRNCLIVTTTQRNALVSLPGKGFMIYNSTINKYQVRENSVWRDISTVADTA